MPATNRGLYSSLSSFIKPILLPIRVPVPTHRHLRTRECLSIIQHTLSLWQTRTITQRRQRRHQHRRNHPKHSRQRSSIEDVIQETGYIRLDHLRDEAAHLLGVLEIRCGVDETAGDVAKVHASERVDGASVTTDGAVGGVGHALLGGRDKDVGQCPCIVICASIPLQ